VGLTPAVQVLILTSARPPELHLGNAHVQHASPTGMDMLRYTQAGSDTRSQSTDLPDSYTSWFSHVGRRYCRHVC
jgi:hypothetical protein